MRHWSRLHTWWGQRLRRRLLISFTATLLSFLALLGYLAFRVGYTSVKEEIALGNQELALLSARNIGAQYDAILSNVQSMHLHVGSQASVLEPLAHTMLDLRRSAPLTYRALYLFDSGDNLVIHLADPLDRLLAIQDAAEILNRPSIALDSQVRIASQQARGGEIYLSPARIVGIDQVPVVYMGLAVTTAADYVLVAEIDLRDIWRGVDKIYVGRTGRAFVVSHEGLIIAHPDRAYVGRPLPLALQPVLDGYEGQVEYTDPLIGRMMLASYSPVSRQSGWGIVVEQERSEALAPAYRIAFVALGISLLAIVMASAVTTWIAQSITRPIMGLARITQHIAHTGDLSQEIAVRGHDEVWQLATAFNQMIDSRRQAEGALKAYSEQLEDRVAERTRELREAQERLLRQERLAMLGQLAGSVAHELRTPLGAIKNAAYFVNLAIETSDSQVQEALHILNQEVNTSDRIISSLLDFARARPPAQQPVDVNQVVLESLARSEIPVEVQVEQRLDETLPPIVADPDQLRQVFGNIIHNAVQAMPGGGRLAVSTELAAAGWIAVAVTDTGVGILPENLGRVFEPLFTTKAKGFGLGLALAKMLVEGHGGRIEAESQVGQGSTFAVHLPTAGVGQTDGHLHTDGAER